MCLPIDPRKWSKVKITEKTTKWRDHEGDDMRSLAHHVADCRGKPMMSLKMEQDAVTKKVRLAYKCATSHKTDRCMIVSSAPEAEHEQTKKTLLPFTREREYAWNPMVTNDLNGSMALCPAGRVITKFQKIIQLPLLLGGEGSVLDDPKSHTIQVTCCEPTAQRLGR